MSKDDNSLYRDIEKLQGAISNAIDWAGNHLKKEEGQLATLHTLKSYGRQAKRLMRASSTRPCIAVFGASQAGKSYLVSNLVRLPESDTLEISVKGGERNLNFITEMNPSGGRESTGLVTRFTIVENAEMAPGRFFLKLLTQTDIVKIIANGYFNDLKRKNMLDIEQMQELFKELRQKTGQAVADSLDEDDIYDLKEYLEDEFPSEGIINDLKRTGFWDEIAYIVPRLKSEERYRVFEILWGKIPVFTIIYNKLASGLKQLNFACNATCDVNALIPREVKNKDGVQVPNTIIDVQLIDGLLKDEHLSPVTITGDNGVNADLSRSTLTALVAEITLVLPKATAEHSDRKFLETADVLDFPGARSRLKIESDTIGNDPRTDLLVFLRGKIAYLFDSYNFTYGINALLLTIPDGPPEVKTLPELMAKWIKNTHGETPEKRTGKTPSLFVVFTKFNKDLEYKPGENDDTHASKFNGRLFSNFSNEMDAPVTNKWTVQWDANGPFKNCF